MGAEFDHLHMEIAENRKGIRSVTADRNSLHAFKLSHQGLRAELNGLNQQLADLEVERKGLGELLVVKERLVIAMENEKQAALGEYKNSIDHATDLLKFFTLGFDESLVKVGELQPDFPFALIEPPSRV